MSVSGKVVDGRFRLERSVGSGGMGDVYLATDLQTNRPVAIKVLRSVCAASADAHLRLKREIEVLSRLHSPYIAELISAGQLADSSPYFVMEYLEGRDLRAELRRRGPLPIAEAAAYLVQACRGIRVAHELGIVHRDLKPPNLFVTGLHATRLVKIVDFGVAKLLDSVDPALTATDTIVGTPLYLSPELLLDTKAISTKVDIWALGVILYELLTGFAPFYDESPGAVIAAITLDEPVPIRQIRPEIPSEIDELLSAALTKSPARRLDSASEFEQRLIPFASPPDRLVVTEFADQQTNVAFERPARVRSSVDVRNQIRAAFDVGTKVDVSTRRRGNASSIDRTPNAERRGQLPSLRRLAIPALETAKTKSTCPESPECSELSESALIPCEKLPDPMSAARVPSKRWLWALPIALGGVLVALVAWVPWTSETTKAGSIDGVMAPSKRLSSEVAMVKPSVDSIPASAANVPPTPLEAPQGAGAMLASENAARNSTRQAKKPAPAHFTAVSSHPRTPTTKPQVAPQVPLRL